MLDHTRLRKWWRMATGWLSEVSVAQLEMEGNNVESNPMATRFSAGSGSFSASLSCAWSLHMFCWVLRVQIDI